MQSYCRNFFLLGATMLFEIFIGIVLWIAFVGVLIDQAPDKKEKKRDKNDKYD